MSGGRYTLRGYAWQGYAFAGWALAGGGAVVYGAPTDGAVASSRRQYVRASTRRQVVGRNSVQYVRVSR